MTSRPPSCSVVWCSESNSIMASVSNSARKSPAAATKPPQLNAMKVGVLEIYPATNSPLCTVYLFVSGRSDIL